MPGDPRARGEVVERLFQRGYDVTGEARRGDTRRDETAWSPEVHDFKASDYTLM